MNDLYGWFRLRRSRATLIVLVFFVLTLFYPAATVAEQEVDDVMVTVPAGQENGVELAEPDPAVDESPDQDKADVNGPFQEVAEDDPAKVVSMKTQQVPVTGLTLTVLGPDGEPAMGATVTLHKKYWSYYYEEYHGYQIHSHPGGGSGSSVGNWYYEPIWSGDVQEEGGLLRVPGTIARDLDTFMVEISGLHEGQHYLSYHALDGPAAAVVSAADTVPVTFSLLDENGQPFTGPVSYYVSFVDKDGVALNPHDPQQEDDYHHYSLDSPGDGGDVGGPLTVLLSPGTYDFLALVSEGDVLYFLSRPGTPVTAARDVQFDARTAGEVVLDITAAGENAKALFLLESERLNWRLGYYGGTRYSRAYVTAGDYWVEALVEVPQSDGTDLIYWYSNDERLQIGAASQYQVVFGSDLSLETFEAERTVAFQDQYMNFNIRYADENGNRLVSLYNKSGTIVPVPEATAQFYRWERSPSREGDNVLQTLNTATGEWQTQSGQPTQWYYPQLTIQRWDDANDEWLQVDKSSQYNYYLAEFYAHASKYPLGAYRARLDLKAGPQETPYVEISGEGREVAFTVSSPSDANAIEVFSPDGEPTTGISAEFYTLKSSGSDHWGWQYAGYTSTNGNQIIPPNWIVDQLGETNLVILRFSYGNEDVILFRVFSDLSELDRVESEGARRVTSAVLNRDGDPIPPHTSVYYTVALRESGGKPVKRFPTYGFYNSVWIDPGTYHFTAQFTLDNDRYHLVARDIQVVAATEDNQGDFVVDFDSRETAEISLNVQADAYNGLVGYRMLPFHTHANSYRWFPSTDKGRLYLSSGGADPIQYWLNVDLELIDPESENASWHYNLEKAQQEGYTTGEQVNWSVGGDFAAALQLAKNAYRQGDYLEGRPEFTDGFGNRLCDVWIDHYYGYHSYALETEGVVRDRVVQLTSDGRFKFLPEGGIASGEQDSEQLTAQYYWQHGEVAPYLRVYRQNAGGEENRVFNKSNWNYFYWIEEPIPSDWLPGAYRAEVGLGVGPLGPILSSPDSGHFRYAEGVYLFKPAGGEVLFTRVIEVQGWVEAGAQVQLYAYKGQTRPAQPTTTATADAQGAFSAVVTVNDDGEWHLEAVYGEHSDKVTVEVRAESALLPSVKTYTEQGPSGWVKLGSEVELEAKGSWGAAVTARAICQRYAEGGGTEEASFSVTLQENAAESGTYTGSWTVPEGVSKILRWEFTLEKGSTSDTKTLYKTFDVGGSVEGRVLRAGEGVANRTTVSITATDGDNLQTTTGADGSYRFDGLKPSSSYRVSTGVSGEHGAGLDNVVVQAGLVTRDVNLQLALLESVRLDVPLRSGYVRLGQPLVINARGAEGATVGATVTYQTAPGPATANVALTETGADTGIYRGNWVVPEGAQNISAVRVELTRDGATASRELTNLNHPVGGTITGFAKRAGIGVPNLTVEIVRDGQVVASALTAADGAYRVDALVPGTYAARALDTLVQPSEYVEQTGISVTGGVITEAPDITLNAIYTLNVTVQGPKAGVDFSGVNVRLTGPNNYWRSATVVNNQPLTFTRIKAGEYSWATWGANWVESEPHENGSGTFTIPAGGDQGADLTRPIDLVTTASQRGTITGTVTAQGTGKTIPGVTVTAGWSQNASTGADGKYTISLLHPGSYTVNFSHPDYVGVWEYNITVAKGTDTVLDRQLEPAFKVSGKVQQTLEANYAPIDKATVNAQGPVNQFARTDGEGRYTLGGLTQGDYNFTASTDWRMNFANAVVNQQPVNQHIDNLDFTLHRLGAISGIVTNTSGQPLHRVSLYAQHLNGGDGYTWGRAYASGRTDEHGRYVLMGLKPGTYRVTAYGTGEYVTQQKTDFDPLGWNTDTNDVDHRENVNFNLLTRDEAARAFAGNGNSFEASAAYAAPGETLAYTARYRNNSSAQVEGVKLILDVPAGTTFVPGSLVRRSGGGTEQLDNPAILTDADGRSFFEAPVGTVGAGVSGSGSVTYQVLVDQNLSGEVDIKAGAQVEWDTDNENLLGMADTALVFTTITAPAFTDDGTFKAFGKSVSGAEVRVYAREIVDGDPPVATLVGITGVSGRWWNIDVDLPGAGLGSGKYELWAQAVLVDRVSNPSVPVEVLWEGGQMKLEDVRVIGGWNGEVKINPDLGVVAMGMSEFTPFTVKTKFAAQDSDGGNLPEPSQVKFKWLDYEPVTMAKGADGFYTGSMPYGWSSFGEHPLHLLVTAGGEERTLVVALMTVLIDPSGYVYEGVPSNRLPGVTAIVEQWKDGQWQIWDAAKFGMVNPQTTTSSSVVDEAGRYGWDVPAGDWRVIFSKLGYENHISRVVTVPPPETELNINLVSLAAPEVEGHALAAGTLLVTFNKYMVVDSVTGGIEVLAAAEAGYTPVAGAVEAVGAEDDPFTGKRLARVFRFTPAEGFGPGQYRVIVQSGVLDYTNRGFVDELTQDYVGEFGIMRGDINQDGKVDIFDLAPVAQTYGSKAGDASYDVAYDLNGDGVIDLFDLIILSRNWTR